MHSLEKTIDIDHGGRAACHTVHGVLTHWAVRRVERVALIFLDKGEGEQTVMYGELEARVRIVTARLLTVCRPGDRALLLFAPGIDYVAGLLGCLYAGVVAMPAYSPDPTCLGQSLPRLGAIVRDAEVSWLLPYHDMGLIGTVLGSLYAGERGLRGLFAFRRSLFTADQAASLVTELISLLRGIAERPQQMVRELYKSAGRQSL